MGRRPLKDYRLDLGLYTIQDEGPRWKATHLVERFQAYMADPMESVGELAPALELASA
jgi:hypothetical protein